MADYPHEVDGQASDLFSESNVHDALLDKSTIRTVEVQSRPRGSANLRLVFLAGLAGGAATMALLHFNKRTMVTSELQGVEELQQVQQPFLGRCEVVEQDADFLSAGPGYGDFALDHIPEASFCCAMCHGIPSCVAWVWKDAGLPEEPHQCWVMTNSPTQSVAAKGVVSGVPPARPMLPQDVNPYVPPADGAAAPVIQVQVPSVDPRASCSDYGSNCWETLCCKEASQRCFMKTPQWAGCRETCTAGVDLTDPPEAQQPWTCTDVNKEPSTGGAQPAPAPAGPLSESSGPPPPLAPVVLNHLQPPPPRQQFSPEEPLAQEAVQPYINGAAPNQQGTRLFCMALIQSNSYELELMQDQYAMQTSIYACESFAIYSNRAFEVVPGITTSVVPDDLKCEFHEIAWNTNIFISVWHKVVTQGWYQSQDWTVKVDADATFFPNRLRALLPRHQGAGYLVNCQYGLHGPIEVLALSAVNALARDYAASAGGLRPETCIREFAQAIKGRAQWGEDMFLDYCLRKLNVPAAPEYRLLCEAHCDCPDWYWCKNGTDRVSFHPFKRKDMYRQCVANALSTGS